MVYLSSSSSLSGIVDRSSSPGVIGYLQPDNGYFDRHTPFAGSKMDRFVWRYADIETVTTPLLIRRTVRMIPVIRGIDLL